MLLMPLCVLALNDDNHPTYFVTHDGEQFNLCDFITKVAGPSHENDIIVRYFSIMDAAEGLDDEQTDYAFELVSGLVPNIILATGTGLSEFCLPMVKKRGGTNMSVCNRIHNASHCPLDLWAPGERSKAENVAFSNFAFKQQMIEDYINYLAKTPNPNDLTNQHRAEFISGLDLDVCSEKEIEYIEREVARRWTG